MIARRNRPRIVVLSGACDNAASAVPWRAAHLVVAVVSVAIGIPGIPREALGHAQHPGIHDVRQPGPLGPVVVLLRRLRRGRLGKLSLGVGPGLGVRRDDRKPRSVRELAAARRLLDRGSGWSGAGGSNGLRSCSCCCGRAWLPGGGGSMPGGTGACGGWGGTGPGWCCGGVWPCWCCGENGGGGTGWLPRPLGCPPRWNWASPGCSPFGPAGGPATGRRSDGTMPCGPVRPSRLRGSAGGSGRSWSAPAS